MKNYLFNILLLCSINLFAQTNLSNNKEYFDFLYRYNLNQQNLNSSDPRYFGNTISWDMMQLINLYTATKDKSYLVQFIHLSAIAINNRFDVKNNFATQWPPKWTLTNDNNNSESTYFNTIILLPMAKFMHLIINDQTLYNSQLPINIPPINTSIPINADFAELAYHYNLISSVGFPFLVQVKSRLFYSFY
jgi:hypothetical protein